MELINMDREPVSPKLSTKKTSGSRLVRCIASTRRTAMTMLSRRATGSAVPLCTSAA
jgi:hypothetical protein